MVIDLWVNSISKKAAAAFLGQPGFGAIEGFFGSDVKEGMTPLDLLGEMDRVGVDRAVLSTTLSPADGRTAGIRRPTIGTGCTWPLRWTGPSDPGARAPPSGPGRPRGPSTSSGFTPLVNQYPLNHALYYPVYATCEELGIPVSINVGIPGPRVRSRCQDPVLLEDVLIDFPDLVVIGAHMGHPYEELLIEYMLKWPNLYLSNSAYLAKYMHPALITFMGSRRGRGPGPVRLGPPLPPHGAGPRRGPRPPAGRRRHGRFPRWRRRPASSRSPS